VGVDNRAIAKRLERIFNYLPDLESELQIKKVLLELVCITRIKVQLPHQISPSKNKYKPVSKYSSRKNSQNSFHILEHLPKFVVYKNTMNETKI